MSILYMVRKAVPFQRVSVLRRQGYSFSEIGKVVRVSQSTLSRWCRDIKLSRRARQQILRKSKQGSLKGLKAIQKRRERERGAIRIQAEKTLKAIPFRRDICALLASLVYICEGEKRVDQGMHFTNSDPGLVRVFLRLIRKSFPIDERKFRVCVHLHHYHNECRQIRYWSKVTGIPHYQFIKPYQKMNTGKRAKKGYQGCVSIRYHDHRVARNLQFLYSGFLQRICRVV